MSIPNYRLMLHELTQQIGFDDALKIARCYSIPPADMDKLRKGNAGMNLIPLLEQRMKLHDDLAILNDFCQLLYKLNMSLLAAVMKRYYPQLSAAPQVEQEPGFVAQPSSTLPSDGHQSGRVAQPSSTLPSDGHLSSGDHPSSIKQEQMNLTQTARAENNAAATRPECYVSDQALDEIAGYVGANWRHIGLKYLLVKSYQLDHLEHDYNTLREKITQMFMQWRNMNPDRNSARMLHQQLSKSDDLDPECLECLEKYF